MCVGLYLSAVTAEINGRNEKKEKFFTFRMSVIQGVVWCSGRNSRKKRIEQTKSNHKTIVYKTEKRN